MPLAVGALHLVTMFAGYHYGNWYINLRKRQAKDGVDEEGLMSHLIRVGPNKLRPSSEPKVEAPLIMVDEPTTPEHSHPVPVYNEPL